MTTLPFCLPPNMSVDTFLTDYWQKKPLLIKNGLLSLVGMFEPADILELATFDDVTARLISQVGKHNHQWTLQNSPFSQKDFANLPEFWTLLVQNMEQWSPELANLWHTFDFIPQWQRDDIMVSYAPKGGSVGRHFDEYDVFLAQGFGKRRWQLGQMCDDNTEFMADQPLRLLNPDSKSWGEIVFDEILEAGDVLYVPPRLAHYGVAEEDCLTFSFGFRRPNLLQILDNLADVATHQDKLNSPLLLSQGSQKTGELKKSSIAAIKQQLLALLTSEQGDKLMTQAIAETVSKRQYDLLVSEAYSEDELIEALQNGAFISQDLASKIVYTTDPLTVYINGMALNTADINETQEFIETQETFTPHELRLLVKLANGEKLGLTAIEEIGVDTTSLIDWLENGWIMLNESF